MRLAFIDRDGTQFSAVFRIQQEGHQVVYWIDCDQPGDQGDVYRRIGDGLVDKVHSIAQIKAFTPDVVVVYNDSQAHDAAATALLPVWGSSYASEELEADRIKAAQIAARYHVGVSPRTVRFSSPDEAMAQLDGDVCQRWVFKAEGTDVPTSSTHVCDSMEHLHETMQYETGRGATSFVLQEHVQGVEVSTEGWFDWRIRGGWLLPFNSTLERKRMFAGDVGPMSGAMGSVVWAWPGARPRLVRETLEGMAPYLKAIKYVGPLDVNCIVGTCASCGSEHADRGPYPHFLEWTPRLGWDAFEAAMAGFTSSIGEFFVRLGQGRTNVFPISPRGFMVSVRTYIRSAPDVPVLMPYEDDPFFLKDLYRDGSRLLTVGTDTDNGFTVIAEVGHTGETIRAAVDPIYEKFIPRIQAPDLTYRSDLGIQAQLDLDQLERWGYETPGYDDQPWNAGTTAMTGRPRR